MKKQRTIISADNVRAALKGEPVEPEFDVISREPLVLRCSYCDRKLNEITENLIR